MMLPIMIVNTIVIIIILALLTITLQSGVKYSPLSPTLTEVNNYFSIFHPDTRYQVPVFLSIHRKMI